MHWRINMGLDLTQILLNPVDDIPFLYKEELKSSEGKIIQDKVELTLKHVIIAGLLNSDDDKTTGEEKYRKYEIVKAIKKNSKYNDCVLKVDDLKLIKDCIGKIYQTGVAAQAWDLIESSINKEKQSE